MNFLKYVIFRNSVFDITDFVNFTAFNRNSMTLNRIIFVLITTLVVLSSCKKSNEFTIKGKITHADGETIYLEELLVASREPLAEVKVDKNGEFQFSGETGEPKFYMLRIGEDKIITLLVDSVENVTIEADIANFSREYTVEGSFGSELVKDLILRLNTTEHKLDSLKALNELYLGKPEYNTLKPKWDEEYNGIVQNQVNYSIEFVTKNAFSMASVYALYQRFQDGSFVVRDLQAMRTAASALNSIYPNSKHVQALYQNTLQVLERERNVKMQQFIEANGENSPDIVLPDQNGKEIALSSLRGKVVLVQFWAAEDRGSRILNPVLVDAYSKYKRKGFEIYQVSADKNRIEWVDAIDTDKLSWINVGDMEGSIPALNVYNVQELPFNYLLDKEGTIIAKDLKGPGLTRALSQVLK
jgi:peroxiredoxin